MRGKSKVIWRETPSGMERLCAKCHEWLPVSVFSFRGATRKSYCSWCETKRVKDYLHGRVGATVTAE